MRYYEVYSGTKLQFHDELYTTDLRKKFIHVTKKNGIDYVDVDEKITWTKKILQIFNDLFGIQWRKLSHVLNRSDGQDLLKSPKFNNQQAQLNIFEINQKIKKINARLLFCKIELIKVPEVKVPEVKVAEVLKKESQISPPPLEAPSVLSFYKGGNDSHGRTLETIWNYSLDEKESVHNYIQWLFPLLVRSQFGETIIIQKDELPSLSDNLQIKERMLKSFDVMLDFYGLKRTENKIEKTEHFAERSRNLIKFSDHNHLRITRIIQSLRLFNCNEQADAFQTFLIQLKKDHPKISDTSVEFWIAS